MLVPFAHNDHLPPPGEWDIDWDHPIATGINWALDLTAGGEALRFWCEGTATISGTLTRGLTGAGPGTIFDENTDKITIASPAVTNFDDHGYCLTMLLEYTDNITIFGSGRLVGGGASIERGTSVPDISDWRIDAAIATGLSITVPQNEPVMVSAWCDTNPGSPTTYDHHLIVNGEIVNTINVAQSSLDVASWVIGNRVGNNRALDGIVSFVVQHYNPPTLEQVREWHHPQNRWCWAKKEPFYFPVSVAASGGNPWHHYRQMRAG